MPTTATTTEDVIASCSFCGKPDTTVQRLVAGPGVYICNECIDLSATIVEDTARQPQRSLPDDGPSTTTVPPRTSWQRFLPWYGAPTALKASRPAGSTA